MRDDSESHLFTRPRTPPTEVLPTPREADTAGIVVKVLDVVRDAEKTKEHERGRGTKDARQVWLER